MSVQLMATSPTSMDVIDLSLIASKSTDFLDHNLQLIFELLNDYEALPISDLQATNHNGIFTRTYLMKCLIRNGHPIALYIAMVSENALDVRKTDALVTAIRNAMISLPQAYREWVLMRARYILVNVDDDKTLNSQSSPQNLDTIRISGNMASHCISEMMVHEASHLHYYATVRKEEVAKKEAPEVYSAFMRCHRPLERVVFAYHAASNIASVLKVNPPKYSHEIQAIQDKEALRQTIAKNENFLTSYGKELVEALP